MGCDILKKNCEKKQGLWQLEVHSSEEMRGQDRTGAHLKLIDKTPVVKALMKTLPQWTEYLIRKQYLGDRWRT